MTKTARLLAVLLMLAAIISLGSLTIEAAAIHPTDSDSGNPPATKADSEASVRCLSFGLYGDITAEALVDRMSDSSDNLTFVGTSQGLYVVGPDGKLRHFLYSPFGVRFVTLIDDITGDGSREVVVVLNDTQVPALRCYDGVTWEKLWQFAPMAKIWDDVWVKRQLGISGLQVIGDGDSQSVVFISGERVISLDARDGTEHWRSGSSHTPKRLTTVADLSGDDTDEVLLATDDGYICLLNGNTGEARWQTRLPEITAHGETTQSTAEHLLTLDGEGGKVAIASSDGLVRLFDLKDECLEWEVSLPTQEASAPGPIALVPKATPDGGPGILVSYGSATASDWGTEVKNRVALLDAAGNKLWDRDVNAWSLDMGSYGGKPVVIVPTAEEIKLVDLADGESVVKTIPVSTLDGYAPNVRQIGENAFLLVGDMTVISSTGEVLWHYPRIANVKVEAGHFVGDATEDTLFSAEWKSTSQYGYTPSLKNDGVTLVNSGYPYSSEVPEAEVRLLKVMDGATGEIAWSYEVPLNELKSSGGLKGIELTADLVGNDGVQDVVAYREDTVFIFSGKDGTSSSFPVGQPIASLDVTRNGSAGHAIAVSTASGLTIFDSAGTELWTTASGEWAEDEAGKFMVLDDLNSDNVSDLAVLSAAKIVLLGSTDNTTGYELHLTFNPVTDCLIEYVEVVPDANGDGVRDLAYIQRDPGNVQPDQYTAAGCPVLLKRSPVSGEELLRVALPGREGTIDLVSSDFNGDGNADSLFCYESYSGCSGAVLGQDSSGQEYAGLVLCIISGKDGSSMWTHIVKWRTYSWRGWNINPPAISIGDVTGDGKDDLAWTLVNYGTQEYSGYYCSQQRLEIYDVAHDESVRVVPATPLLMAGLGGYGGSESSVLLPADLDGDGHSEILAAISEPLISSSTFPDYVQHLAVLDTDTGQRPAAFVGFYPGSISVFEAHQPGILGVAAAGGVYYLDTDAHLQVTSPADGSSTGPVVGVRWEGASEGGFVQVFVDGVRNYTGNDSGVDLYLARGRHDIVVWSIDDYGRILYGPSDLSAPVSIKVTPSFWKPVLLVLSLFALLAMTGLLFYSRLHRVWRVRRRTERQPEART